MAIILFGSPFYPAIDFHGLTTLSSADGMKNGAQLDLYSIDSGKASVQTLPFLANWTDIGSSTLPWLSSTLRVVPAISLHVFLVLLPLLFSIPGCWTDANHAIQTDGGMAMTSGSTNPQYCMALCENAGFIYSGVEYGTQCQ